jgi:hypothetical protein
MFSWSISIQGENLVLINTLCVSIVFDSNFEIIESNMIKNEDSKKLFDSAKNALKKYNVRVK